MKRLLIALIIIIISYSAAFAEELDSGFETFGFAVGCFTPQEKDFDKVYDDRRDTALSLFYDKEITDQLALGALLTHYSDEGRAVTRSGDKSKVSTKFTLVRAEASGIYRMILHNDQFIVPQVKAGISCTYFNEKIEDGDRTENVYFGYNAGFALLMLLDALDPDNAYDLNFKYGIEDTYFFIGMNYNNTDAFKKRDLDLGGIEYNLGLAFRY